MGDSVQNLSRTYHDAAQTISAFLSPRCGDLVNAQQSFLAATWHKGEADFVRSWHELGATVRLVQEMSNMPVPSAQGIYLNSRLTLVLPGVHIDVHSEEINEFDLEMRRRLWCALYTWERCVGLTLAWRSMLT